MALTLIRPTKILGIAGWRWRLSGLQKSSPLPDGANAYPAYKNPHHCRMALALIRPTTILTIAGWR